MKTLIKGAAILVTALTMAASAQAAEWIFYGSARVGTWYSDVEKNGTSEKNFSEYFHGNARIGAKVTVNDQLKGKFEYGAKDGNANIRQLYGEWNFGAGKLLVGQTYTPIYTSYSSQAYGEDKGLEKYGTISASRKPMLRLTLGGFQIAAVEQGTDKLTGTSTEVTLPKLEASYSLTYNNISVKAVGGYNKYEIDNTHNVTSYVLGLGGKVKFGSAFLAGTFFTGQNLGPYGFKNSPSDDPIISGSNLIDNDSFGYTLVAGYKINDMLSLEAGYGYTESELNQAGAQDDDAFSYYLQSKITMAPGVYIVPEIGMIDEGKDKTGAQQSETTYLGAKWQINF